MTYPPKGLREFGNAIEMISKNQHPSTEEISRAGSLIEFNFKATQAEHPEWNLTSYRFLAGPTLPKWEYEDCSNCAGESDEVKESCPDCEGAGVIPIRVVPGVWRHTFGWYTLA